MVDPGEGARGGGELAVTERKQPEVRDRFGDWQYTNVVKCSTCRWYDQGGYRRCAAFERIPDDIWLGQVDHTEPYPGDKGYRYEPAEG